MASDKSQQAVCSRVAQILKREREKRGLSMNVLSQRAGLSQQMISFVERGLRNPTLETLLRITAAMEVNLAELIGEALHDSNQIVSKRKS